MKTRHFLLFVVVLMSLWFVGCAPEQSRMEYLATGGRAEIRGEMNGVEFSAVIEITQNGEYILVEYLSPDALCGLKLIAQGEECQVTLGDVSFVCDVDEVAGFLRPATVLLPYGYANSVQKEGENTLLTFPDGGRITLSQKGEPVSFLRDDIRFDVVWWEKR